MSVIDSERMRRFSDRISSHLTLVYMTLFVAVWIDDLLTACSTAGYELLKHEYPIFISLRSFLLTDLAVG